MKAFRTIFVIALLLLGIAPKLSFAASDSPTRLVFSSAATQYSVGDHFSVDVLVQAPTQPINAVSGSFTVPSSIVIDSINVDSSIVSFWAPDKKPALSGNQVSFEGALFNAYKGKGGLIFSFDAHEIAQPTSATFSFDIASVLASDGFGDDIMTEPQSMTLYFATATGTQPLNTTPAPQFPAMSTTSTSVTATPGAYIAPMITGYPSITNSGMNLTLTGTANPNATLMLHVENATLPTLGDRIFRLFRKQTSSLTQSVIADSDGNFKSALIQVPLSAGVYAAWAEAVDSGAATPVPSNQIAIRVNQTGFAKLLVQFTNVLVLVIPIVALIVAIYLIPWYAFRKVRVANLKFTKEEETLKHTRRRVND